METGDQRPMTSHSCWPWGPRRSPWESQVNRVPAPLLWLCGWLWVVRHIESHQRQGRAAQKSWSCQVPLRAILSLVSAHWFFPKSREKDTIGGAVSHPAPSAPATHHPAAGFQRELRVGAEPAAVWGRGVRARGGAGGNVRTPARGPARASRADGAVPELLFSAAGARHGCFETAPSRGAAGRGPASLPGGVRGRARAGRVRAGPRQPHRGTHGLQPGPGAAYGEGLRGEPPARRRLSRPPRRAGLGGAGGEFFPREMWGGQLRLEQRRTEESPGRAVPHVGREEARKWLGEGARPPLRSSPPSVGCGSWPSTWEHVPLKLRPCVPRRRGHSTPLATVGPQLQTWANVAFWPSPFNSQWRKLRPREAQ